MCITSVLSVSTWSRCSGAPVATERDSPTEGDGPLTPHLVWVPSVFVRDRPARRGAAGAGRRPRTGGDRHVGWSGRRGGAEGSALPSAVGALPEVGRHWICDWSLPNDGGGIRALVLLLQEGSGRQRTPPDMRPPRVTAPFTSLLLEQSDWDRGWAPHMDTWGPVTARKRNEFTPSAS